MQHLLDVVTAEWRPRRREPLTWLASGPAAAAARADAQDGGADADLVTRPMLASALASMLFADVVDRVPSARSAARAQAAGRPSIVIDHLAVVAVGTREATTLRRLLGLFGWATITTRRRSDGAESHELWRHVDDPDGVADWHVTELQPAPDDADVAGIIDALVADEAPGPAELSTTIDVSSAAFDDGATIPVDTAAVLLAMAVDACSRRRRLPTTAEYATLLDTSERLAWWSTEGTSCDHMAIRTDDAVATQAEERISGRPVAGVVEHLGPVRSVRHRRAMVRRALVDPDSGDTVERSVPGSYLEFTESTADVDVDAILEPTAFDAAALVAADGAPAGASGDDARTIARPAHTFKVRRRRLSPKRQAEFDDWLARWGVDLDGPRLDWDTLFDRPTGHRRRNGLDIGFGHGESTIVMARAEPDLDVIGVEVHDPGVVTVLDAIEHEPLPNVRVLHGDVIRFLRRVEAESLDVVRIFFPDPWHKARQHHRRLVRADVVAALTDRLLPGGELHLATDIADYAAQMQEVCDGEPRLTGGVIPRPAERPLTRFEQRGLDAGRPAVDLRYHRR